MHLKSQSRFHQISLCITVCEIPYTYTVINIITVKRAGLLILAHPVNITQFVCSANNVQGAEQPVLWQPPYSHVSW